MSALQYLKGLKEGHTRPDAVAGHSLGEYTALLRRCFNFETGLRLVAKRGELMSEASEGGMAAVIGLDEHHIKILQKYEF